MLEKSKNNRGQVDFGLSTFAVIVLAILFLAPVLVKMVEQPLDKFSTAINRTSTTAGTDVANVESKFLGLFDIMIVFLFLLQSILLLISAFLIDTHPAFMIMYILIAFFLVAFLPNITSAVETIYDSSAYSSEIGQHLAFSDWMVSNFGAVILALIVLSGIILYAKIKYFSNNGI